MNHIEQLLTITQCSRQYSAALRTAAARSRWRALEEPLRNI
jgi:hypothetical protein